MKKSLFKGKSTRTKIYTVISIVGIVLLLGLNLLLTYVGGNNLIMIDLTYEGFYTLSDKMLETCHELFDQKEGEAKKEITVTFCADPDYLTSNDAMRATYFMALSMQKKFDNVTVKTVNVGVDPMAVAMYKTTSRDSISSNDVIFSYGGKYRIVDASTFWTKDNFSYNGEYRVASILASLTAIEKPVAYFVTNYGTEYYDPANPDSENSINLSSFADLITERGLEIRTLDLSKVESIPDDCALLIINNPTEDFKTDESTLNSFYHVSDLDKIDKYLVGEFGAVMFNKAYNVELPEFENFCKEWGISFGNALVTDRDNALYASISGTVDDTLFAATYDTNEANFGPAYYGTYSYLQSAPKMVFSNTGYVYCSMDMSESMVESGNHEGSKNYAAFIGTSAGAYHLNKDGSGAEGVKTLVAASVRTDLNSETSEKTSSYFFCSNSEDFFSNEILGNASYSNYDVLASVISNITRTDRFASIELGGFSYNSTSFGGKQTLSTELSPSPSKIYTWDASDVIKNNKGLGRGAIVVYTILVMVAPVAILTLGIIMFIKRKFL